MLYNIYKILSLAFPIFIGQMAIIAFSLIDTIMIGHISSEDLAVLNISSSIYISVYISLIGMLSSLQIIASQLYGAKCNTEIGKTVFQSIFFSLILIVIGLIILLYPKFILNVSNIQESIHYRIENYLFFLSLGLPAGLIFRIYIFLANAINKPIIATIIQCLGLAIKIPLNICFIFGFWKIPAMGSAGCAISSTVIYWISCIISFILLNKLNIFKPFKIFNNSFFPSLKYQIKLFKIGIPIGISHFIEVTSFTFMSIFISHFGIIALAGHQIISNISSMLYMIPMSIGMSSSIIIGQKLGIQEFNKAKVLTKHAIITSSIVSLICCLILIFMHKNIINVYTSDIYVKNIIIPLILIVAIYHFFDSLQITIILVLRSYKIVFIPTLIYMITLWGFGLGGGYILGFNLINKILPYFLRGASGFWHASAISLFIASCCLAIYLNMVQKSLENRVKFYKILN